MFAVCGAFIGINAGLKKGEFFPPFLYLSVINSCNLRCQGCWVDVAAKQHRIEVDAANHTIAQAKAMGNSFFGILGGEPFMHKDLLKIFEANRDVYFQVFTNGHFITDEVAAELRRLGKRDTADQRRRHARSSATRGAVATAC